MVMPLLKAQIGEASNLIPILASDSSSHAVAGHVYNGLVNTIRTSGLSVIWRNRIMFHRMD
jgi:hypothetical protein